MKKSLIISSVPYIFLLSTWDPVYPTFEVTELQIGRWLFIYCCVTNHPTFGSIRQQTLIISPSFMRVRNLRVASLSGSRSGSPTSCSNLKVSLALKGLLQVHLCGCWQVSVPHWLRASHFSFSPFGLLHGAAHNKATSFLQSESPKRKTKSVATWGEFKDLEADRGKKTQNDNIWQAS